MIAHINIHTSPYLIFDTASVNPTGQLSLPNIYNNFVTIIIICKAINLTR